MYNNNVCCGILTYFCIIEIHHLHYTLLYLINKTMLLNQQKSSWTKPYVAPETKHIWRN
jgi:hypothetical protein